MKQLLTPIFRILEDQGLTFSPALQRRLRRKVAAESLVVADERSYQVEIGSRRYRFGVSVAVTVQKLE
ncbi:hypothetical protein M0R72_08910 [Candidatus Pacearchaeota archaeon]|jgi:uncharacterized ferritin-like protein (DUF455 family)|nr:hypothetical protein [Candidatus Pacearchaeota archaeon]